MTILEHAAAALNAFKAPWVMAADWNVNPAQLAASGFLQMVNGVLFQPTLPTCHDNTFDFFVVHRSLAHAVVGVQRIDGVGVNPHKPVRLLLRGDARRFATRQMVRPKKIPAVLAHGPVATPPNYSNIAATLDKVKPIFKGTNQDNLYAAELDSATKEWYT